MLKRIAVIVAIAVLPFGQSDAQTCLTPPPDSPILAPSIADIPPGSGEIITYTGAFAPARANGKFAFAQVNENEQKFWFGADSSPPDGNTYYNRRYRANASSPWYWQYSTSITVMNLGDTSTGPNSVLYSPTPKYRDPATWTNYKYLMYAVSQPRGCDGVVLGVLFVSFSQDGICWTPLRPVYNPSGPSFECYPGLSQTFPVEAVSAIDGGSTIYLIGIEGDILPLLDVNNMDRTFTYAAIAWPESPDAIWPVTSPGPTSPELDWQWVFSPAGIPTYTQRYLTYRYLVNLDMAFDAATGYLYLSRAYPHGFDRWAGTEGYVQTVPCEWQAQFVSIYNWKKQQWSPVQGCSSHWAATLPNRIQIYRTYIGSLANFQQIRTNWWTLVADLGGDVGYTNASYYPSCAVHSPRTDPRMQNVGRDYAYATFVRDGAGMLVPNGANGSILAGDSYKLSKGPSYCYVTGNERITLVNFPR